MILLVFRIFINVFLNSRGDLGFSTFPCEIKYLFRLDFEIYGQLG